MFTGLIEATGIITSIEKSNAGAVIWVASSNLDYSDVSIGDSIAVNGVCLTAVEFSKQQNEASFRADLSQETLQRSCFANYVMGQKVNLEKALLPTTRLGGHLVSGHVDGIGKVQQRYKEGNSETFIISAPEPLYRYIAEKGSICVDGISLTVNAVDESGFRLTIVPHTLENTGMGDYEVATQLNLEVDLLARYTEQLLKYPAQSETNSNNSQG
jgi:riboflavin synthase